MQRRTFLKNTGLLLGAGFVAPVKSFAGFGIMPSNDVVKFNTGKFVCTLFRDLQFTYEATDFFTNATVEERNQALSDYSLTDTVPSPFVALLIDDGSRKVLVDTGIGLSTKPVSIKEKSVHFEGRLQQLLQREKINAADITDVVITHCHPDHIGGVFSDEGRLNFPAARFHLHTDEWAFWHSPASAAQPASFRHFIDKNITPFRDGNLNLIHGDFTEFLPGLTAVKAEGHTPGHIALLVRSAAESFLYASDAFLHPLHIERLNWQTSYDLDHAKAKQSRSKLLDLAYNENMLVNAFHFDFPGLGKVDKRTAGWKWVPTKEFTAA